MYPVLLKARDSTHFNKKHALLTKITKLDQLKSSGFFRAKARDISRLLVKKWPKLYCKLWRHMKMVWFRNTGCVVTILIALLKWKLQRQNFAKFRGTIQNSATQNSVWFHGIFANSVLHTDGTEVKKGTEFRQHEILLTPYWESVMTMK
jgi:REP element-mobilizing transposase RayT